MQNTIMYQVPSLSVSNYYNIAFTTNTLRVCVCVDLVTLHIAFKSSPFKNVLCGIHNSRSKVHSFITIMYVHFTDVCVSYCVAGNCRMKWMMRHISHGKWIFTKTRLSAIVNILFLFFFLRLHCVVYVYDNMHFVFQNLIISKLKIKLNSRSADTHIWKSENKHKYTLYILHSRRQTTGSDRSFCARLYRWAWVSVWIKIVW